MKKFNPFVIKYADFSKLKLLDEHNTFHNDIHISQAKDMAKNAELDLVCFNLPAGKDLAFCKIIDYGKWKYNEGKNNRKVKKESKKKTTKEIRFSPLIDDHDIDHKINQAQKFLMQDNDVVLSMRLKGRQLAYFKEAEAKLNEIAIKCDNGKEVSRRKARNNIVVRLAKA